MPIQGFWGRCFNSTQLLSHPHCRCSPLPSSKSRHFLSHSCRKRIGCSNCNQNDTSHWMVSFLSYLSFPANDSCIVVAVARTNITGRTDSLVVQGCTCALALLKTFSLTSQAEPTLQFCRNRRPWCPLADWIHRARKWSRQRVTTSVHPWISIRTHENFQWSLITIFI